MSVIAPSVPRTPSALSGDTTLVSWKAPIALAIFTALGILLLVVFARDGISTMRLSTSTDLLQLPEVELPTRATGIVVTLLLALITGWSSWLVRSSKKTPIWSISVFAFLFLVGFLAWASAGNTIPVPGLLFG
jgi:simple sugar transport system permease protein